jgi:DEAD/DEAH box helicase domain-containing protein
MIPALVAHEIRESILDHLRTTWALSDRELEKALFAFLEGKAYAERPGDPASGIFRGPYLRLRLPFSPKPADAAVPLDLHPSYDPYLHQLQAWHRLSSKDGAEPQATLVTTGTGSGKTECFLYPLLAHCYRAQERGEGGIKAIVLYPMNALAADQARRFAEIIHQDKRTSGNRTPGAPWVLRPRWPQTAATGCKSCSTLTPLSLISPLAMTPSSAKAGAAQRSFLPAFRAKQKRRTRQSHGSSNQNPGKR